MIGYTAARGGSASLLSTDFARWLTYFMKKPPPFPPSAIIILCYEIPIIMSLFTSKMVCFQSLNICNEF